MALAAGPTNAPASRGPPSAPPPAANGHSSACRRRSGSRAPRMETGAGTSARPLASLAARLSTQTRRIRRTQHSCPSNTEVLLPSVVLLQQLCRLPSAPWPRTTRTPRPTPCPALCPSPSPALPPALPPTPTPMPPPRPTPTTAAGARSHLRRHRRRRSCFGCPTARRSEGSASAVAGTC